MLHVYNERNIFEDYWTLARRVSLYTIKLKPRVVKPHRKFQTRRFSVIVYRSTKQFWIALEARLTAPSVSSAIRGLTALWGCRQLPAIGRWARITGSVSMRFSCDMVFAPSFPSLRRQYAILLITRNRSSFWKFSFLADWLRNRSLLVSPFIN